MMFLIHILKSIQLKKVSLQEFANLLYIIHVSRGGEISMAGSIVPLDDDLHLCFEYDGHFN